ncbi:addiction module antidote protein, HigA family [Enterorhabdus sp. P55]|nr:HigA family addiction module antitoxin [Enterorhabdus sp. P55]NBI32318.1 addiction module antidote protein, HigA family [Enterorhabdus sp. P55]
MPDLRRLRSLTTTDASPRGTVKPVTPGELLRDEFLEPLGISQYRLAKEIGVPAQRIGQIVLGRRRITADTDLRLCRFFGLTDGYWLRAQTAYDIDMARRDLGAELKRIKPWGGAACL